MSVTDNVSYTFILKLGPSGIPTNLVQHFITFIKNKHLDTSQSQVLVTNESIKTSRRRDDDMRVLILVLEDFDILLHRSTTVEHGGLNVGHVFAEPRILILNLICKLTSVTHHKNRGLSRHRVDLLKSGKNEYGSLTKTRFGLAEDISAQDGLRDTHLLD